MARVTPDDMPQVQAAKPQSAAASSGVTQSPEITYEFEVVSIKSAPPDDGRNVVTVKGGPGTADPGQFTGLNITLRWLLVTAYPEPYSIVGPDWLDAAKYDMVAKVPPGTTKYQFRLMVRKLLEERLVLKAHHEMREFRTYDLVVAKGGAKLKEATEDPKAQAPAVNSSGGQETRLDADGFPQLDRPGILAYHFNSPSGAPVSRMVAKAQPISSLAKMLRSATQAYVTDKTGLEGKYDFRLEYSDSVLTASSVSDGTPSEPAPNASIFSAIKNLGLVLQQTKTPLDVLVIDHIDRVLKPN